MGIRGHSWVLIIASYPVWDSVSCCFPPPAYTRLAGQQASWSSLVFSASHFPMGDPGMRGPGLCCLPLCGLWQFELRLSHFYSNCCTYWAISLVLPEAFIGVAERKRSALRSCPWFGGFKEHGRKNGWLICMHYCNWIIRQTHEITQVL